MKKKGINLWILSSALVFSFACSNKTKVLSAEKIEAILHDTYLAESLYELKYSEFASNDKREAITDNILKKYGVTRAEFDSSLIWYSDNAESFIRVNDSVISTLRQDLALFQFKPATSIINSNIIGSYAYLSENNPLICFKVDSTLLQQEYPNFSIEFKTLGFDETLKSSFIVNYIYSDTIITDSENIIDNKIFSSSAINNQTSKTLKSINGYVYVDPLQLKENKVLLYNIKIEKN